MPERWHSPTTPAPTTRLLVATRGEAGTPDGAADPAFGGIRESELICAAKAIGLDEVSILDGDTDGAVADEPFERLVRRDRRLARRPPPDRRSSPSAPTA